ncbi:MAG: protocatechuate 4,5-dioxygenase subunit alpha [Ilumatobacter sp.]|uniref:protocatechuate 4,5-dioxygenase subunit alpha n=1 Tax=Ilumatobacter sp. TaxID=1967498 RepID=UPI002634B78C|nr:protocatechuate 4,5-dioxygenase subunit alpha [Ilumatobacter sp.]MDJ0767344.1 protocatechuate 4,5-dioxygenase subunit alpha [Ilumatobacter sp.]
MPLDKPYLDIPGTTIFDADQARKGYHLNQFAKSLMDAGNRERFKADERAYLDEWDMTDDQKQAVIDRDFNRILELGGNIYFVAKVGACDGLSYVEIVSSMTENDAAGHQAMMLAGGRSPDGNRYLHEWEGRGEDEESDG